MKPTDPGKSPVRARRCVICLACGKRRFTVSQEVVMPTSLASSEIEVSADVAQLAAKLGVTAFLPQVLEMTRTVFPEARLEVEAYQDHELADE